MVPYSKRQGITGHRSSVKYSNLSSYGDFWLAPKTDQSAAVDDQLWALRIQSLRAIDASIMPTMPSANLNAGVLMIA